MNHWKLATIGIVTVLVTSLATGVTTAWLMRPAADAEVVAPTSAPARAQYAVAGAPAAPRAAVAQPGVRPTVRPVAATTDADCATTGDRVWRIAKPGLVGTLLGAGAGAAGGAIADGGKAAGKGAMIGGLAGAALGTAYGAYKTKNECGTILGSAGNGFAAPAGGSDRVVAYRSTAPAAGNDRIAVFDAGRALPR